MQKEGDGSRRIQRCPPHTSGRGAHRVTSRGGRVRSDLRGNVKPTAWSLVDGVEEEKTQIGVGMSVSGIIGAECILQKRIISGSGYSKGRSQGHKQQVFLPPKTKARMSACYLRKELGKGRK